jgi:hypothetical protein
MPAAITTAGTRVLSNPADSPEIILVAAPVSEETAIVFTGLQLLEV